MKKGTVRAGIILAILVVLYNLLVFLIPFSHGGAFWASYAFTWAAFLIAAAAVYTGFVKRPDAKSKFYGFPILKIAVVYLAAQLVAGLIFMAVGKWVPGWIPVLVYAIAMGAAVIGLISADAVVAEIHHQDQKLKKDTSMMRSLQSKVMQMAVQCEDGAAKQSVRELADAFRFSDPVSGEALAEVENDLKALVDELQQTIVDGETEMVQNLCRKIQGVLAERNRLCKLNK